MNSFAGGIIVQLLYILNGYTVKCKQNNKVKVKFFIMPQTRKCTRGRKHEKYTDN